MGSTGAKKDGLSGGRTRRGAECLRDYPASINPRCFVFKPKDLAELVVVVQGSPTFTELDVSDLKEPWVEQLPDLSRVFTLQCLYARGSSLKRLPALPTSIRTINVNDCANLIEVAQLPEKLTTFEADNTPLGDLPEDMPALNRLSVRNTRITRLPILKPGLKDIWVDGTPMTVLPRLPEGTTAVSIKNSAIAEMEPLPDTIRHLALSGSKLTRLPNTPSALDWLGVEGVEGVLTGLKLPKGIYVAFAGSGAVTGTI